MFRPSVHGPEMTFFECFYSIGHGVIHEEKALEGFARRIQPMYAGAKHGAPVPGVGLVVALGVFSAACKARRILSHLRPD